jgi:glucoamylase
MLKYFLANTDIQGQGGVVASPDHSTPGGSYYYAWERDGALSMRALLDVTPFGQDSETRFQHYTQWVLKVQNEKDPNGIDVRTEPKYNLPAGDVFTDGWCRPQTDGPGLRAKTLMAYAEKLMAAGKNDDVKQYLWTGDESKYNGGAIKYDLDWVADNWESDGCDLWEEIRSNDFFWNRFMFRAAMHIGAKFASTMGDSASSSKYSAAAQKLDDAVQSHWNGNFVYETDQRQKDAAVFEGFNHGDLGDGVFGPTSKEVAGTVSTLAELFCNNFAVNGADTKAGVPGVLIGRYDGDHYAGGNPWHLLTASLAQILYRGATQSLNAHLNNSTSLDAAGVDAWKEVLGISQDVELSGLAQSMAGAGDGVLTRLKKHVSGDNNNLHMAEQLDRNTGVPMSAKDLTWSYANVLSAVHSRQQFVDLLEASQM